MTVGEEFVPAGLISRLPGANARTDTVSAMVSLPLNDAAGNTLLALDELGSASLDGLDPAIPCPLSLVVVQAQSAVLMGFNAWRKSWELPGGMIDPGETAAAAALRELGEETGLRLSNVRLTARAHFVLGAEQRHEYAAVFAVALDERPQLVTSDELTDLMWWDPEMDRPEDMSPLDAEIARLCFTSRPEK